VLPVARDDVGGTGGGDLGEDEADVEHGVQEAHLVRVPRHARHLPPDDNQVRQI